VNSDSRRYQIDLVDNETGDIKTVSIFKLTFAEAASHAYVLQNKSIPEKYRVHAIKEMGRISRWQNL
tara:strand:+ start:5334 stop:5534 length:201 start_codon:yes stop_codon:yes gene_type:complete